MTFRHVSFDPLRTIAVPGIITIKPEHWLTRKDIIMQAEYVLFPEYWQVNVLSYAWKKPIFPSINSFHLGHDKVEMTRAFQALCPDNAPHTLILGQTDTAAEQVLDEFTLPFVAKDIRNSMGLGVYLIKTQQDFLNYYNTSQVLYIQEYLPINKDLRLVVVGEKVVAAYWRKAAEGQFHNNVSSGGRVSFENIPEEAVVLVETFAKKTGINHAGFDVAEVDGHLYFLEFNIRFGTRALTDQGICTGRWIDSYLKENPVTRSGYD